MNDSTGGQGNGLGCGVGDKSAGSSTAGQRSGEDFRHLRRFVVGGALLWAILIAASLAWNIHEDSSRTLDLAGQEAVANFNKDRAIRLWAASHGALWLAGMVGIFVAYWQGGKRIATRRQAGVELEAKERYFRSLLYNMHEDIVVIDGDYVVTDVNNTALITIGRSRQEAVGRYCYEILRNAEEPCDPKDGRCPLYKVFSTGRSYQSRHTHTDKDGAVVHVDILASPMTDENGNVTHVVQAMRDITEQKELEEQLRQSQKMEAVGRLAGGIAHDFRNQLTIIVGYAGLMLSRMGDDGEHSREIREILQAADRSTTLTSHLLAFSRREILEPEILAPMDLIGGMTKPLKHIIGQDVRLSTSGADDLDNITVDPGQFEHMLMNLVINARDAMPDGGELKINVAPVELDGEFVRHHPGASVGKYIAISVSDTGVGMDVETCRKAFEPFFTTKGVGEGTGLGLSMVYGFVKQSGGYVTADSEPGQGATFTIYLPSTTEPPKEADSSDEVEPAEVVDVVGTILVTEDDEQLRDMLVEILRKGGHTVLSAGNARQALPLGEHYDGQIDMLITDLVMPGMNGIDLAVRLRAARPDIAVMFMSGHGDNELIQRCLTEGDAELLVKPFGVNDLLNAVNRTLAHSSIRPQPQPHD